MSPGSVVIVGGGLAGAKAAETLRTEGFEGPVVLVGEEAERPYDRPPPSKGFLRGEDDIHKTRVHHAGFYEDHAIELRTGTRVRAIDGGAVELRTGERLPFHRLLLATRAEQWVAGRAASAEMTTATDSTVLALTPAVSASR